MTHLRAARDVTLALLRAIGSDRLGLVVASPDFSKVDWHAFVAFSSAHFILPAMAGPLVAASGAGAPVPADLLAFVEQFRAANRRRNEMLSVALSEIAAELNSLGSCPVALKGAAFLADRESHACDWRFMGDIDLLVPEAELQACVAALRRLGYRTAPGSYDPTLDAHFPPLVSPCLTYSVELHTRLFGGGDFGIALMPLRREATELQFGSARLAVPSMPHRIAHLLAHAQLHNRNALSRRLVLKDVLDLTMLPRDAVIAFERDRGRQLFAEPRHLAAARALLAAWHLCLDLDGAPDDLHAQRWAQTALDRLAWPHWRALASLPGDAARIEGWRLLHEPGHLRRRATHLLEPKKLQSILDSWTAKQRQRLWR